jgi:hypothetical protein
MEIRKVHSAAELPEQWDKLATDYFQTRDFLGHTEAYNPCDQRYYIVFKHEVLISGLVIYTLRIDLLTYLAIPSPFRMKVIGIPCSVSSAGIIGDIQGLSDLLDYLKGKEKGLLLVLNLDSPPPIRGFIMGRTLPTIVMEGSYDSWEDYLQSLRSDYRRRINRISASFTGINLRHGGCSSFNKHMYALYRDVLKRSKGKLETLSLEFFRNLPPEFQLTACYDRETLIGWFITVKSGPKSYFFMGGIDYSLNATYQTYFNLLNEILRETIRGKSSCLDLGQTAEVPKVRLGGRMEERSMLAYHSCRLIHRLLRAGKVLLEYTDPVQNAHVYKSSV